MLVKQTSSIENRIIQQNIERNCVVYYLDIFLDNLKKKEFWQEIEIFILSDHGARFIKDEDASLLSAIFAVKSKNVEPGIRKDKLTINYLFNKLNN